MNHKLTFLFLLGVLILTGNTFSQDRPNWLWNSPKTQVGPTGEYTDLPNGNSLSYVNPNTTTRIVHTSQGDVLVPPNVRPFPSATATESEIDATTMMGNQNVMYASWNSYGPAFYGTGFCYTSNGGTSWTGNTQMIVSGNNGDPGPWVWSSTSAVPGRLGLSVIGSAGISATYSTDAGTTWTAFANMGGSSTDKNLSCVDDVPGSPFLGRAYTVWTDFAGTNVNRIVGAYSSNNGVSWTGYQAVSPVPPAGHHMQGCDVKVGPGGVVYVVWATCTTNGQNSTEDFLGFAKSTDGGVTWPVSNVNVVDVNGIRSASFMNGIRSNGFPRLAVDKSGGARNGWIYAVMCEKSVAPAIDNGDVCIMVSSNGGTSWSHTRVNGDPAGALQWEAAVCVDQITGMVAVGYYDQRGLAANQANFYVSFSNNGGSTWSDVQVSDHVFVPAPISGLATGYQGDYTGITYSNGKIFPFWADNSSGIYQCWTCALNPVVQAHDCSAGPFLGLPQGSVLINVAQNIKTRVANLGTSNETTVPVKYYINNTLTNTTNVNLNAGQVDSVNNAWTPTTAGTYNFMYIIALGTDGDRSNDTVRGSVTVVNSLPALCDEFVTATFPPTGWTEIFSGTNYWSRVAASCAPGSGSLLYDMWDAPNGTVQSMITPAFPPTTAGYSIAFAEAFQSFGAPDSLVVYSSTNGGTTWVELPGGRFGNSNLATITGQPSPFVPANRSQWARKTITLPTGTNKLQFYGRSGFGDNLYVDSVCLVTPVGISHNQNEIPKVYSLSQNYPNPFNPSTQIQYALPKAGFVTLRVYDVIGKEVATLVNEMQQPGTYNFHFDASNLASGVYFYRIDIGDGSYSQIKKMMLIK